MWCLITRLEVPLPPQPQIPLDLLGTVQFPNPSNKRGFDEILAARGYSGPISYCALLLDQRSKYEWVDNDLRNVLYRCMFHRPADRPSLEELLEMAKGKVAEEGQDTDNAVRSWVKKWLYDAPPPSSSLSGGDGGDDGNGGTDDDISGNGGGDDSGGNGGDGGGDDEAGAGGDGAAAHASQTQYGMQFDSDFPNGADKIPNHVPGNECGCKFWTVSPADSDT